VLLSGDVLPDRADYLPIGTAGIVDALVPIGRVNKRRAGIDFTAAGVLRGLVVGAM